MNATFAMEAAHEAAECMESDVDDPTDQEVPPSPNSEGLPGIIA